MKKLIQIATRFVKNIYNIKLFKQIINLITLIYNYRIVKYLWSFNKIILYYLGILFVGISFNNWDSFELFNEIKLFYDGIKLYVLNFFKSENREINHDHRDITLDDNRNKRNDTILNYSNILNNTRPINFINIPCSVVSYKNLDNYSNVLTIRKKYRGKGIIYGIENNLTNQIYIGSTTNSFNRIGNHLSYHNTKNSNFFLQNSIKIYGLSNFTLHIFNVVELATHLTRKEKQNIILPLEQKYIDLFPILQLFNIYLRTGSSLNHKINIKKTHTKNNYKLVA